MTKITKLVQKTFDNKPSGFTVTFDDNRSGNLQEKESDKGLREGDSVIVTEIPYTSKAGKTSTLYGVRLNKGQQNAPPQQNTPLQSGKVSSPAPTNSSIEVQKSHAAVSAMEFIVNAVVEGKLDWPQLAEKQREATQILWNEIDEIYNGM
jgi:hypothetical protein